MIEAGKEEVRQTQERGYREYLHGGQECGSSETAKTRLLNKRELTRWRQGRSSV